MKDTVVQAIKPRSHTENLKKGRSKKQVQEKKTQNRKDNETKSKRKTKLPAKFLDGIDSKDEDIPPSLSFIRKMKKKMKVLQRTVMIQIG